jgi:hypothetical protein
LARDQLNIVVMSATLDVKPVAAFLGDCAVVNIPGVIDMPTTRAFFTDRPDEFFLRPDAIADTYFHLAGQDRSAWTFEVDLRPFGEKW